MQEQAERAEATEEHRQKAADRLADSATRQRTICPRRSPNCDDISGGRKRCKLYRQFKMYNDPTMNPYLYGAKQRWRSGRCQRG